MWFAIVAVGRRRCPAMPLMSRRHRLASPSLTLAGCRYAMLSMRPVQSGRKGRRESRRGRGGPRLPIIICRRRSIFGSAYIDFFGQQSPLAAPEMLRICRLRSVRHSLTRSDTLTGDTVGEIGMGPPRVLHSEMKWVVAMSVNANLQSSKGI